MYKRNHSYNHSHNSSLLAVIVILAAVHSVIIFTDAFSISKGYCYHKDHFIKQTSTITNRQTIINHKHLTTLSTIKTAEETDLQISYQHPNDLDQDYQNSNNESDIVNGKDHNEYDITNYDDENDENVIDAFTQELPPFAASTIDGRLLCASQCAYEIKPQYFRPSAFRPATTAKRLTKGVNSVIIGHTYDGICVAFRGTQSSSPLDWLQNAALFLSNVENDSGKRRKRKSIKGKLHTGFYRGTKSLWKPLRGIIRDMIEESAANGWKQDVVLTGHSKGGAMASVAAVLMKTDPDLPDPSYVCTFASAKVGDSEFCTEYNKHINQTSYEAHLDMIPFLPPSSSTMEMMDDSMTSMLDSMLWSDTSMQKKENYKWDYQTVGTRKFINEHYEIINEVTKELDEERIKNIEQYSFLTLEDFKSAHCSSCPADGCNGYYFNAIAGGVCFTENDEIDDNNHEIQMKVETKQANNLIYK